jgi:hypothetical protein
MTRHRICGGRTPWTSSSILRGSICRFALYFCLRRLRGRDWCSGVLWGEGRNSSNCLKFLPDPRLTAIPWQLAERKMKIPWRLAVRSGKERRLRGVDCYWLKTSASIWGFNCLKWETALLALILLGVLQSFWVNLQDSYIATAIAWFWLSIAIFQLIILAS